MVQPVKQYNIAVLISGTGTNLKAILEYIASEKLNINVKAVISNKADAPGLDIAHSFGIKTISINAKNFSTRELFDKALQNELDILDVELIVLAGYMRILSAEFVKHFTGRLINIHPSLLPKHKGLNTYQRALEAGDSHHGCSIHFVTEELDDGPIIAQAKFLIQKTDTLDTLQNKTRHLEYQLYPKVIRWMSEARIKWCNNDVLIHPPLLAKELPQHSA